MASIVGRVSRTVFVRYEKKNEGRYDGLTPAFGGGWGPAGRDVRLYNKGRTLAFDRLCCSGCVAGGAMCFSSLRSVGGQPAGSREGIEKAADVSWRPAMPLAGSCARVGVVTRSVWRRRVPSVKILRTVRGLAGGCGVSVYSRYGRVACDLPNAFSQQDHLNTRFMGKSCGDDRRGPKRRSVGNCRRRFAGKTVRRDGRGIRPVFACRSGLCFRIGSRPKDGDFDRGADGFPLFGRMRGLRAEMSGPSEIPLYEAVSGDASCMPNRTSASCRTGSAGAVRAAPKARRDTDDAAFRESMITFALRRA